MRSKAIFMALLALAFGAQARPVSVNEAKAAACAWAKAGRHLNAWIGTQSDTVLTRTTAGGATFHAVRMAGGGTVITSGDTEVEPIVAFTSEQVTEEALDPKGPLYALLKRDLEIRQQVAPSTGLAFGPTAYAAKRAASATANERKWSALIAAGVERDPRLSFGLAASPALPEISDMRVDALMRTKWSQGDGIWNYYTPPGKDHYTPDNAVCGCVATATAQVMRYLHGTPDEDGAGGLEIPFPLASVERKTFACQYKGNDIDLTMQGGTYAWDDMPFTKAEIKTAVQMQNIGKLTSDVGISVNMMYAEPDGSGSGAYYANAAKSLVETFGYRQASWVILEKTDIDSGDSMGIEGPLLFANFDARRPCMVGIPGHAIVADGYGFDGDLPYTHLNMGWAGSGDMWYNLPDMTAAGDKYTVVQEIGYNVFPEIGGIEGDQTTHGILSGRVLDDDGNPVPSCAVAVRRTEDGASVTNLVTDAAGIWAAILPAGKYDVEALTDDQQWIGVADGLVLEAPGVAATVAEPGNSWGNDITLEHPSVRLGAKIFSSIDRAVEAAREQAAAAPDETFVLEVLDNTWLKRTQTIDFRCAIVATNDDPYASVVTRRSFGSPKVDAAFEVATNGFLSLGNVVFAGSGKTLVSVASNGVAAVSGLVDFGVSYETAAIRTESADGFMLAGELVRGFTLDCAAAPQEGQVFGFGQTLSVPVFEGITNTADLIANLYDPDGETRAYVVGGPNDYTLVWRKRPVPFGESVGYYIDRDGGTNTAARIDRLFRDYEAALAAGRLGDVRKMVIRRDGALTRPLSVVDGLTLTGEGGAVVTVGPEAGFTLTGGDISVEGIVFSNYTGNALFLVDGANLKIGAGTVLADIRGTNRWSGAVTVLAGSATVGGGARFERCRTKPVSDGNAYGGAIYLAEGSALSLEGCTITNCFAANYGGAVYADAGSRVSVTGELWIAGNRAGEKMAEDDLYLHSFKPKPDAQLLLTGPVEGSVGVCCKGRNESGARFADAERAVDAHESAVAFFRCTRKDEVVAEAVDPSVDSSAGLRWTKAPVAPQPLPEERKDEASARVTYKDGTEMYYLLTYEALEALAGDATVEIIGKRGNYIRSDLEVEYAVTLKSDGDVGFYSFERRGDCSFVIGKGASLTLQDIDIRGCQMTNGVDETGNPVLLRAKPDELTSVPVFDVCGGSLSLETPSDLQYETEIAHVYGATNRNAGAVSVWEGGTFRIESGAVIRDCVNFHVNEGSGSGRGGAVLVDNGCAKLFGGTITNCFANNGGGVFIGNGAGVEVKGDMVIDGNFRLDGTTPSNLYVYDRGQMVLTGELTGHVGYTEGVAADTEVFGRIDSSVPAGVRQSSAHNFTHDTNGDVGMAVSNGSKPLLVWSSSLDAAGNYTDEDGTRYALIADDEFPVEVPVAIPLTYDGSEQIGVPAGIGYEISGNAATAAGGYTATLTLRPGFVWSGDEPTGEKTVPWTIAKATYDMSGITFDDVSFPYDGLVHELTISGTLPDGVSVSYTDNALREIGSLDVTATFTGDSGNYEEIDPKTATLTVFDSGLVDPPVPPETDPFTVDTNTPTPIAFSAITRKSDTEWELVVTDLVERAEYALSYTPDLLAPFKTGEWFTATSSGPTNLLLKLDEAKPAHFWRAHGRTTYVTNWSNAIPPQPQP